MAPFTTRRVDVSDRVVREALRSLALECFEAGDLVRLTDSWFLGGTWWVTRGAQRREMAFCGLRPSHHWAQTGYLALAGVVPAARGQGLQKRLIRVRLAECRRRGWHWAITDTIDNPASACSLIAAGFRPYHPSVRWGGQASTYWRRAL